MTTEDYRYTFDAIGDRLGSARLVNHQVGEDLTFQVAMDDHHLLYRSETDALPQIADMVDLALAVHIADRFSGHASDRPVNIHITLPVRRPELFAAPAVIQTLHDALYWYTENSWSFTFERRTVERRRAERQTSFGAALRPAAQTEVTLWSGGLDSFAGLWQRQMQRPDVHYVLFGTGPNATILSRQQTLAKRFRSISPVLISLVQVPLRLRTPYRISRNRHPRTRGLVFLLLGAVCAHLEGQSALHLYENGVGAINLPFRATEVGVDHSRAVHPLSLLKMENLISLLLDAPFTIINPFLFQTKAEICAPLKGTAAEALAHLTISCDSRQRRRGQPIQCGRCSSCLLRRQALAAIELDDQTKYAHEDFVEPDDRFVLELMIGQRNMLRACLATTEPWITLRRHYPVLEKTVVRLAKATGVASEQITHQVLDLYMRYADEWDQVQHARNARSSRDQRWAA